MVKVKGIEFVAFNLSTMSGKKLNAATVAALDAMGKVAVDSLKANTSLRDHTLQDLQNMGHPYASRHPSIKIHQPREWLVHSHSGALLSSVAGRPMTRKGKPKYRVGFINKPPKHAKFVVKGTKLMHPRDVVRRTVNEPGTRGDMMRAVVKVFGAELRTKAGLRFRF